MNGGLLFIGMVNGLLIRCCVGVAAVVAFLYGGSYVMTAGTYYRIVRK